MSGCVLACMYGIVERDMGCFLVFRDARFEFTISHIFKVCTVYVMYASVDTNSKKIVYMHKLLFSFRLEYVVCTFCSRIRMYKSMQIISITRLRSRD